MFNGDIEASICKPTEAHEGFYRNGEGDEVVYVHRGARRRCARCSARCRSARRTTSSSRAGRRTAGRLDEGVEQFWVCFHTPGEIETPNRYRNRYGQLLEHAPYSQRDFHGPTELETIEADGEFELTLRVRDGYQSYVLDRHPFDVVGWDGYVYPYTFNAMDFEPRAGRFHLPPPAHQTFQGPNFVICTFAPRMLDWDETAVPLPYHHSNIQSEEVMFYADGDYAARKGVEIGCLTLHPSGLPHGPQPGHGREGARRQVDQRARRHVGHLPAAEADRRCGSRSTTRPTPTPGTRRRPPASTPSRSAPRASQRGTTAEGPSGSGPSVGA